jgi:excisionase family DNA binding protein
MKLREFYTLSEVADRLGLDYLRVYDMTVSGQLPYTLFGENVRAIRRDDVAAFETSRDFLDGEGHKGRQVKENNLSNLMKPGEYYTLEQAAERFGVSKNTVLEALRAGLIEKELFGGALAIHESQADWLLEIQSEHRGAEKYDARQEILAAGFVYSRNPPPGAPRGSSRNPSPFRRGWSKDGVYYGPTAVKALREWRRRKR